MVFPYGPFTFLRSPLIIGNNYLIAFVFRILLRFLFIYSTIYLLRKNYQKYWLIRSLVFLVMLFFINFDTEYFGLVVSIIFLHKFSNRKIYLIFLVSFIVLGFFIKSALGIYTGMFVASYFIYLVLDKKKILFLICLVMLIPVLFSISWFLCFNSLDGMISLITGYFFFTAGNSSAVSLIPDNNWMQLIPAILILLLYPFYRKDKITWFIYLIFGLFLFASWKYGMARQDFLHQQQFFINFLLFWSFVIIFSEKMLLLPLFAGIISLFLLFLNINVTSGGSQFPPIHTVLNGFDNFNKHIIHYNLQQKKYLKDFNYNLEGNILPAELRETISKKTVDVYPWNYGVIAANKLNYKPRPLIQSYLSYSSWLDNRNNIYFSSGKTPEFILWELIQGRWSDSLTSIDGRYGLNDEPQTILSIIQHYDIIQKDKRFLLFKKTESAKQIQRKIIKSESLMWKKWVKVPKANLGILRAKIDIKRNFWGYLKNFFFKDEVFYVEMKLEDGSTRNYRIIKGNFGGGIWINPLIANPVNNFTEPEVKEIRILSSNYHLFKEKILVDWELITFSEVNCLKWNNISSFSINPINLYFKKNDKPPDTCIIQSLNDYEKEYKYWNTPAKYYSDKYLSGHRSFELDTNSFSNGFKIHGNDIDYH